MKAQSESKNNPTTKKRSRFSQEYETFSKFISKSAIVPVAIGIVIGQISKEVVNNLVEGIITPLISLALPKGTLSGYKITVRDSEFLVGQLLDSIIEMLIIMLIIYLVVRYIFKKLEWVGLGEQGKA